MVTRSTAITGRTAAAALAIGLGAFLHLAWVAPAAAAPRSAATVAIGTEIKGRARVEPDRTLLRLEPGQRATVMVMVKVRLAPGSAATVVLDMRRAGRDHAPLAVRFAGTVSRSGVHAVPLTITLAKTARGPVTLPLAFDVSMSDAPDRVAAAQARS